MITVYHLQRLFRDPNLTIALHTGTKETKIKTIWEQESDLYLAARVATNSLDEAYRLTNSDGELPDWHYWGANPEVTVSNGPSTHRSTSVGDVLETEDGKRFMVDDIGFLEIPDRRLAEAPIDKLPMNMRIHPLIDELIGKRLKER